MEQGMERAEEDEGKNENEETINKAPDSDSERVTFGEEKPVEETKEPSESLLQWVVSSDTRYRKLSIVTHLLIIFLLTVIVINQSFVDVDFELSKIKAGNKSDYSDTYTPYFTFQNKGIKRARDVHVTIEIYRGSILIYRKENVDFRNEDHDIGSTFSSDNEVEIRLFDHACQKRSHYKFIAFFSWNGGSQTLSESFYKLW